MNVFDGLSLPSPLPVLLPSQPLHLLGCFEPWMFISDYLPDVNPGIIVSLLTQSTPFPFPALNIDPISLSPTFWIRQIRLHQRVPPG